MLGNKLLVTGGTGYIGSQLIRFLSNKGYKVAVLSRDLSKDLPDSVESTYRYTENYESVENAFRLFSPSAVIHLAASCSQDVEDVIAANVTYGTYLLEAMKNQGCRYLINTGSYWQYTEHAAAQTMYAASKTAFQSVIDYYCDSHALLVHTLYLMDVYGPMDNRPKLIPSLIQAADSGESIALTPGYQKKDFLYIDDVISAYLTVLERFEGGLESGHYRYFVSSGKFCTVRALVQMLEASLGSKIPIEWGAKPYPKHEIMQPIIQTILPGWVPMFSLEKGLKRLIEGRVSE